MPALEEPLSTHTNAKVHPFEISTARRIDELAFYPQPMPKVVVTGAVDVRFRLAEFAFLQRAGRPKGIVYVVDIEIEGPNFLDRRFNEEIQNINAGAANANYGNHIVCKLGREIRYFRPACERVVELEHGVRHLLDGAERVRIHVVEFHCRSRYDGRVAFNLVEEVGEFLSDFGLVRESSLHDNVRTGFPKWQPCPPAGKVRDRISIEPMRDRSGEPNLMVVLFDGQFVYVI